MILVIIARAGFQFHDVQADDVHEIFKQLNEKDSRFEVYPIIKQMLDYIIKNPRYVGMLPRRVSVAISANTANVNSFFANDLYFTLACKCVG